NHAEPDIKTVDQAHSTLEAAIGSLPDLVGKLKKELAARVGTSRREFGAAVKKARRSRAVEAAVNVANGFKTRMEKDQTKLLEELGFHELDEEEQAAATKSRAEVLKQRKEFDAKPDQEVADAERKSRDNQLNLEEAEARRQVEAAGGA